MLAVQGQGLPLGLLVGGAQTSGVGLAGGGPGDSEGGEAGGPAQDKARGPVADKGCDGDALGRRLRARGIRPCIPWRRNARPRPGRRPHLSGYRQRWVVERTFAWLGGFRRLVVRWERKTQLYPTFLLIACIVILLRAISG